MKKNLLFTSIFFTLIFYSCEKKEFLAERLVGYWVYSNVSNSFLQNDCDGIAYTTPPYPGKCEYLKDYFLFTPLGQWHSVVYGSDCSDSIRSSGLWRAKDFQLNIIASEGFTFSAEILELLDHRLVLKTKTNKGCYQVWAFLRH